MHGYSSVESCHCEDMREPSVCICQWASWALNECLWGLPCQRAMHVALEPVSREALRIPGARGRWHWHLAVSTSPTFSKSLVRSLKNNYSSWSVPSMLTAMEPLSKSPGKLFSLPQHTGETMPLSCSKRPLLSDSNPKQRCVCSSSWSVQSNCKCQPGWWF